MFTFVSITLDTAHTALGLAQTTLMILPQVPLRKPCYDFYFL